jgi:hypothetical protein
MEKFPNNSNKPEVKLGNNKNTFLDTVGKISRKVVLGAALASATMATENVSAQTGTKINKTEQSTEHTSKTDWAEKSMNRMKSELTQLSTANDVIVFQRETIKPFLYNIGMLSEGKEIQNNYSIDEYKKLLSDVENIKKTFEDLEKRLHVEDQNNIDNNIEYLIKILKTRTSYSGFHEYKKLHNLE